MKVCIHRGTKEIGGTCVEIEAQGKRIVLDVGVPLDVADPDRFPLHPVKGFETYDPSLLGVVISHPHQDHYGLAYRLPKETLFAIGKGAAAILEAAGIFTPSGLKLQNVAHLVDRTPITLGPFTITPYLVDHSAFDAYAVLVEAEGVALFYSGDLRAHGRKGKLFHKLLRLPPKHVDVLLMEGTTLGRPNDRFPTEAELEDKFVELFKKTTGMPLVWCSGQNIDRITSVLKACMKTGRTLILDMYTAHILRATENKAILGACEKHTKVFLPFGQKRQIKWKKRFDVSDLYKHRRIYDHQLAAAAPHSVMLFRPSMAEEVGTLGCLDGARLIYSMWSGYLKDEKQKPFLEWLKLHNIPLDQCHTSGHAAVGDLVKLRELFKDAPVVPIHTEQPDQFEKLFGNVQRRADGEWWEVCPSPGVPVDSTHSSQEGETMPDTNADGQSDGKEYQKLENVVREQLDSTKGKQEVENRRRKIAGVAKALKWCQPDRKWRLCKRKDVWLSTNQGQASKANARRYVLSVQMLGREVGKLVINQDPKLPRYVFGPTDDGHAGIEWEWSRNKEHGKEIRNLLASVRQSVAGEQVQEREIQWQLQDQLYRTAGPFSELKPVRWGRCPTEIGVCVTAKGSVGDGTGTIDLLVRRRLAGREADFLVFEVKRPESKRPEAKRLAAKLLAERNVKSALEQAIYYAIALEREANGNEEDETTRETTRRSYRTAFGSRGKSKLVFGAVVVMENTQENREAGAAALKKLAPPRPAQSHQAVDRLGMLLYTWNPETSKACNWEWLAGWDPRRVR